MEFRKKKKNKTRQNVEKLRFAFYDFFLKLSQGSPGASSHTWGKCSTTVDTIECEAYEESQNMTFPCLGVLIVKSH